MDVDNTQKIYSEVLFNVDAKKALLEGSKIVADAVGCTMGPRGQTVLIQQVGKSPVLTKDGVTVSHAVKLKDPLKRMGGDLLRDSASRTNESAGDGTTTATVLSFALMKESFKLLEAGIKPLELITQLEESKNLFIEDLKKSAIKVDTKKDIIDIATISANGDNVIGTLIAEAIEKVGRDGIVTVDDAKGMQTSLDFVQGLQFERGYLSPYFVTNNDRMISTYEDANVLITDKKLSVMNELVPVLEHTLNSGKALLIIADDIDKEALQGLVVNKVKNNINICAVKAPGIGNVKGHMLEDIAILTGGKVISSKKGIELKDAAAHLGSLKKFIVGAKNTTLVALNKFDKPVSDRINDLNQQLMDPTLDIEERSLVKLRIARLAGGVAVIKVGGSTELEMVERRYRIEDALNATRAAIEEGYVPGGGTALYNIAKKYNALLLNYGCFEPLRRICENSGKNFEVIDNTIHIQRQSTKQLTNEHHIEYLGYNAKTDTIEDLVASGIIDPVKVTRTALENAVSVATAFISLGAAVYDIEN